LHEIISAISTCLFKRKLGIHSVNSSTLILADFITSHFAYLTFLLFFCISIRVNVLMDLRVQALSSK